MIRETHGDIFKSGKKTLVVPCNSAGAMGSGLAKVFRQRFYPGLFNVYRRYFPLIVDPIDMPKDDQRAEVLVCVELPAGKQALLFCTKHHWSGPSDITLIERNLASLARDWDALRIQSLAIPPIGCGLGGLDYRRDVRPLLLHYLSDERFDVEIVGLSNTDLQ